MTRNRKNFHCKRSQAFRSCDLTLCNSPKALDDNHCARLKIHSGTCESQKPGIFIYVKNGLKVHCQNILIRIRSKHEISSTKIRACNCRDSV